MLEKMLVLTVLALAMGFHSTRVEKQPVPSIIRTVGPETDRDTKLEHAIIVAERASPHKELHYYFNRVDLRGDGKLEALVFVFGPGQCGTGGCEPTSLSPTVTATG
jgi:hypothetical protein